MPSNVLKINRTTAHDTPAFYICFILKVLIWIPTAVQESKEWNIKPVMAKEVLSMLYSSETSLQWPAPHLALMHNLLYIRLSEPGGGAIW